MLLTELLFFFVNDMWLWIEVLNLTFCFLLLTFLFQKKSKSKLALNNYVLSGELVKESFIGRVGAILAEGEVLRGIDKEGIVDYAVVGGYLFGTARLIDRRDEGVVEGVVTNGNVAQRTLDRIHQQMAGAILVGSYIIAPAIARIYADIVLEHAAAEARIGKIAVRPDLEGLLTVPHNIASEDYILPASRKRRRILRRCRPF